MSPEDLVHFVEFVAESREHADLLERSLLTLEREPSDAVATREAFRAIHSIKGNASLLGLGPLEALGDAGEAVLARVRSGTLRANHVVVDALLGMIDTLRELIDAVERDGQIREVSATLTAVLARLRPLREAEGNVAAPRVAAERREPVRLGSGSNIRVDVTLLDRMVNLVGELVLARNQVVALAAEQSQSSLGAASQRLDLVTSQLQDAVMKTRMQPVARSWQRFPRVVRELCLELDKQAVVELEGTQTELDKRIIEALHDPLTHLLRNAIDHGIESPAQRRAAGKPSEATIDLRAFHRGGLVNIELRDDGAGVDFARVRARVAELGLLDEQQAARADEAQLLEFLFHSGLSTRAEPGRLSGRGVGLDVVRANIEGLGGSVELRSRTGRGTTVAIKIPLTLAIIPALIVVSADQRFAIPQANLIEVVRVGGEGARTRVEWIHEVPVLRLRGRLLPLVDMRVALGCGDARAAMGDGAGVVVLQAESRRFGLLVDAVHDAEEIVVKPLWRRLERIPFYSGATVLGDGCVVLILDTLGLARVAHLADSSARELGPRARAESESEPGVTGEHGEPILLCRCGESGRVAVKLAEVARLELIDPRRVEVVSGLEVVQYGDDVVPLISLAAALADGQAHERAGPGLLAPVVIHRHDDARLVGLVVDELIDIVHTEISLREPGRREGVLGTMAVLGRVTEFVDVDAVIARGLRRAGAMEAVR